MSEKDYAIAATSRIFSGSPMLTKPVYLITFETSGKVTKAKFFIAVEKPEMEEAFVQVKGIFSELSEEEIINSFAEILTTAGKESILEMYFPWHRISSIRSLVFKANKDKK
jgi:hypothetical protein